jgi:hypothetical protein
METSRRPHGDHGDVTELPRRFSWRLSAIRLRVLFFTLSLRFHVAHNCAEIVKLRKGAVHKQYNRGRDAAQSPHNLQVPRITTAFIWRYFCTSTTLLLRCRRCYWVATASLLRSRCAFIRTPRDGVCFEYAQNARRRSAFYAMPLRCCGDVCDLTALMGSYIFYGRRENAALVWQGLNQYLEILFRMAIQICLFFMCHIYMYYGGWFVPFVFSPAIPPS